MLQPDLGLRHRPVPHEAEFDLTNPDRHELLAICRVRPQAAPCLLVDAEALGFRWWPPSNPVGKDMNPLDAEIARRVIHSSPERNDQARTT